MKILIVGSNAREHALARALTRSGHKPQLFCCGASYNPGIAVLSQDYALLHLGDCQSIVEQALNWQIELALIGPEAPLALGLVDALQKRGIACIGPQHDLARVESSKGFARLLMRDALCSPRYQWFQDLGGVREFLAYLGAGAFVIKPDGLSGGKGVKLAGEQLHSLAEAYDYCAHLVAENQSVLIEEKLSGQEFSLHSFADGKHCIPMPAVKDFKRAYAGDRGPNTGSMGSLSDADHSLPFLDPAQLKKAQELNQYLLAAVQHYYQKPYKGILYGSFIATADGVKLIEFNARFGDPEALNLLALLETDFVSLCIDLVDGALGRTPIVFSRQATVCKYAVPAGYPDKPLVNQLFDYRDLQDQKALYLASLTYREQGCYTTASRSAAVLGIAASLAEAEAQAEAEIQRLKGPLVHRADIGLKASYA